MEVKGTPPPGAPDIDPAWTSPVRSAWVRGGGLSVEQVRTGMQGEAHSQSPVFQIPNPLPNTSLVCRSRVLHIGRYLVSSENPTGRPPGTRAGPLRQLLAVVHASNTQAATHSTIACGWWALRICQCLCTLLASVVLHKQASTCCVIADTNGGEVGRRRCLIRLPQQAQVIMAIP